MTIARLSHERPQSWRNCIAGKPAWLIPILLIEWPFSWSAYALSRWSFLEVLEYLGSFSVLVAVIFYFREPGDRIKQKHYQAWQVINTAQHMGGTAGRIDALTELNADGVALVGVDVSSAFLQGLHLPKARLLRANFKDADVRNSNFEGADLSYASLYGANFGQSSLNQTSFAPAILANGDFCWAQLRNADLTDAELDAADLGNADLSGIKWQQIKSIQKTNLGGKERAGWLPCLGAAQWSGTTRVQPQLSAEGADPDRRASRAVTPADAETPPQSCGDSPRILPEIADHELFFHAALNRPREPHQYHGQRTAHLPIREKCAHHGHDDPGIDRMPYQPVRSATNQIVMFSQHWCAAPVAAEVTRAQVAKAMPATVITIAVQSRTSVRWNSRCCNQAMSKRNENMR